MGCRSPVWVTAAPIRIRVGGLRQGPGERREVLGVVALPDPRRAEADLLDHPGLLDHRPRIRSPHPAGRSCPAALARPARPALFAAGSGLGSMPALPSLIANER